MRIDGDDQLQLEVRLALFHLMASVADRGEAAVGARGITGHAYRGHVFWDADLFVLPFLAATEPAAARAMLEYRCNRLPAALAAARAEGRRGARFPWESAAERIRRHAALRARPCRARRADPHRRGRGAHRRRRRLGRVLLHRLDRRSGVRRGPGLRILVETARYWASRIRLDALRAGAHLRRDRTRRVPRTGRRQRVHQRARALEPSARGRGGRRDSTTARSTPPSGRAGSTSPTRSSTASTRRPASTRSSPASSISSRLLIRDVAPRRPITADLLLGPERVRRAQVVKQADVLMLHHLLPDEVAPGSLAANLDYYEPRTAHGSSLSPGIHAALFARAGRIDDALDCAADRVEHRSRRSHADRRRRRAPRRDGRRLAGARVRVRRSAPRGDALVVDPVLPARGPALELRVRFRGVPLRLRVEPDAIVVNAPASIVLLVDGRRIAVRRRARRRSDPIGRGAS